LNIQVFGDGNFAHDRYLYLPSVGFSMLTALGLRRVELGRKCVLEAPAAQVVLILAMASVLAFGTVSQSLAYSSDAQFYARCHLTAPHNDTVKANYASILGEQGRFPEALQLLQEILARHPDLSSLNYNLGYTYYRMGNLDEANRYLARTVELNSRDAEGFFYLGITNLRMGHVDKAALDVRKAIAIDPYTDNYHFALGVILKLEGNLAAALEEFHAELALNPNHSLAKAQIAQIGQLRSGKPPSDFAK
jgi:tetratricopeptide (TPR) repeat protein